MSPTYLTLLWHMHQPFYKDLAAGVYVMPWVRLHALKDYYGMVAILKEFPSVHVTFNLVPSLVVQVQDYAQDLACEPSYEIAFKPVDRMTSEERETLAVLAFQLNRVHLLGRYPRFVELFQKAGGPGRPPSATPFSPQDLRDLQVLSQLAWFDEIYLEGDAGIKALVMKQQGYTEADKSLLRRKEVELFNKVLEEYKLAFARGQIEISTSPFYHPILPLLCDSNVAAESHPGTKLPRSRFRYPEDARDQLRAAIELYQRVFGRRPDGLWPSEGSISDEVLDLAAQEGFRWAASDEGVLARSLQLDVIRQADGTVARGEELYRPHKFVSSGHEISLLFRDHQLSDLVGFVYSRMDVEAAAQDLHDRIRAAGRSTGSRPAVVSVILDGENAWEFYPGNGREFLRRFYAKVASDPELRAVTASEALLVTEPGILRHVVPGSWINANFDIWIGSEEDNRAWDLLLDARNFLAGKVSEATMPAEPARLAREELWIAEGSDWCWWYGPEHSSAYDEEFDFLFRKHLSNLYRLLNGSPPDELAIPIKRPRLGAKHVPPTGRIEPRVDGRVSSYFEWLGAGVYVPDYRSGSMHATVGCVDALYYGWSERALYLRLDLAKSFSKLHPQFGVRVSVGAGQANTRLRVSIDQGGVRQVEIWKSDEALPPANGAEVAFGPILEFRLGQDLLDLDLRHKTQLQVSLWVNELPLQVIPQEGWLTLQIADEVVSW